MISKIITSIVTIYFYLIPAFFIPRIFEKYIRSTFEEIKGESLNAFVEITSLKKSISRITSFISFLSIYIGTILGTLFSKNFYQLLSNPNLIEISALSVFVIFGAIIIYKNYNAKKIFMPNIGINILEFILVLLSSAILVFIL